MKRQVRIGVFETNSSSTHVLCICSQQQYNDWIAGKFLYDRWHQKFVPNEPMTDEQKEEIIKEYYNEHKQNFWKDYENITPEEKAELIATLEEK